METHTPRRSTGSAKLPGAVTKPLAFDPIHEAGVQWEQRWGPGPVSSMRAVTSVMRVQQILLARLNTLLKPYGLTFPRYEALMILYFSRRGSLPLGKMGARLQVHPTSVTNLIDGLERAGLVRREPHASDRRTTLASITDSGREIAKAATKVLNDEHFGTGPLAGKDLDAVTKILATVRVHAGDFTTLVGDGRHTT
jgi:DNA-binding MarR family transcriptional regulator